LYVPARAARNSGTRPRVILAAVLGVRTSATPPRNLQPFDSLRNIIMLTPGQSAPAFAVETHEGVTVSLADLAGSNVLLWFYPKADTPG
jgi:peroxiredoxin Q/BCP